MLWQSQVGNKGTQPYIYMYPFLPKLVAYNEKKEAGNSKSSLEFIHVN